LPLPLPAAPAALAAVGSRYGRDPSPADGVLAADVFDAFEAGKTPTQVVQEYELVPRLVADLYRQFLELRAAAGPRGPTVSDRLVLLEQGMAQLRAAHDELAFTVPFTYPQPTLFARNARRGGRWRCRSSVLTRDRGNGPHPSRALLLWTPSQ